MKPLQNKRNPKLILGVIISGLIVGMVIWSFIGTPHDHTKISIKSRFLLPSAAFWLGTDQFGRDIFSMMLIAARNTVGTALAAVFFGMVIGVPVGLLASLQKKSSDSAVNAFSDVLFAFPSLVTAILLSAVFGPGLLNAVIAIGVFNIPIFIRTVRNNALPVWDYGYVTAARVYGISTAGIAVRHVLPAISHVIIVQATVQFSMAILAEAGLSYLGLSIQPPNHTWGKMLYDAQQFFSIHPFPALYPGVFILLSSLGFNLLGESFAGHRQSSPMLPLK